MKNITTFFLCLFTLVIVYSSQAKEKLGYEEINYPPMTLIMHSGEVWKGKLIHTGPKESTITILTAENRELVFSKAEVKEIQRSTREGTKFSFGNPFNGEYLLISSSFPYDKANLYVRVNAASFVSLDYAVTEHFSIGAGAFIADGLKDFPIFGRVKVSVPVTKHFCLAFGGLGARFGNLTGGLAYASASLGTDDIHASAGIAYGFINEELIPYPAILLGGKVRFADNFAIITDNLISPVNDEDVIGLASLAVRFFNKRIALDGGVMVPFASGYFTIDEDTDVLPFGKLTVKIGKSQ